MAYNKNVIIKYPHEVCELICLKCLDRWIGVFAEGIPLKDMTCTCGEKGYIIKTGQTILESEVEE